jgi:L-serine dehydratase
MVAGPPQLKVITPPCWSAASKAASVQLAAVPVPTTCAGCDVSTLASGAVQTAALPVEPPVEPLLVAPPEEPVDAVVPVLPDVPPELDPAEDPDVDPAVEPAVEPDVPPSALPLQPQSAHASATPAHALHMRPSGARARRLARMAISVFDLFKIGIGPSSSHTVGPMRAARAFALGLQERGLLPRTHSVRAELYGSLGATGRGHGSDKAVLLGLLGETPEGCEVEGLDDRIKLIRKQQEVKLLGTRGVPFREPEHLAFLRKTLPYHPNGMRLFARDEAGDELWARTYYSVGGGFVVDEEAAAGTSPVKADETVQPYPFHSGAELLAHCAAKNLTISELMLQNELVWRSEAEVRQGLLRIWGVMEACVKRGCHTDGILPGGLRVRRRAHGMYTKLVESPEAGLRDPLTAMDWVNLYALAVNEENAAGGRVVTAPTNGAAGIIPAVLHYYRRFVAHSTDDGVVRFLLTAAAIGVLYKENASISGAEVG